MKDLSKHTNHYFPLLGIFVLCFLGFWIFSYNRSFQLGIAAATCLAYVAWGSVHHYLHKDLNLEVFIEYFLFGLLGFVIMFFLVGRS